jgi:hypothetical protein
MPKSTCWVQAYLQKTFKWKHTYKTLKTLQPNKQQGSVYNLKSLKKVCGNNDPHNSQNMCHVHIYECKCLKRKNITRSKNLVLMMDDIQK